MDVTSGVDASDMFFDCSSLARVCVGAGFDTSRAFPDATGASGTWHSSKDDKWYAVNEIQTSRRLTADTYTNGETSFDLSACTIAQIVDQPYTGNPVKPAIGVSLGAITFREGIDFTVAYTNNVEEGLATATIQGRGDLVGSRAVTFKIVKGAEPKPATCEMHRLYNPNSGEHFYTAKPGERDALVEMGWVYEGVGWIAPVTSDIPVYRLYNQYAGDHHYTMRGAERDALVGAGWTYEGIGWYSVPEQEGVPLYRQYNPYAATGSHNYTLSKGENDALVTMGWIAEGIGWYGVRQ